MTSISFTGAKTRRKPGSSSATIMRNIPRFRGCNPRRRNESLGARLLWGAFAADILGIGSRLLLRDHRFLAGSLRTIVGPLARRVAGSLLAGRAVGGRGCCGSGRQRFGRIAMLIEERDHVCPVLGVAEACERHLGSRREVAGAGQPFAEIVPVPRAALLRKRI